jgi:hypothetical protein
MLVNIHQDMVSKAPRNNLISATLMILLPKKSFQKAMSPFHNRVYPETPSKPPSKVPKCQFRNP